MSMEVAMLIGLVGALLNIDIDTKLSVNYTNN